MSADGWYVADAQRVPTPFRYWRRRKGYNVEPIDLAVIHWTATPHRKQDAHGSHESRIRRWLTGASGRESSTHFVLMRSGMMLQGAPIGGPDDSRCWHAGGCKTPDGRGDCNGRSVGIDFELVGHLERNVGASRWVDGYGGTYHGPEPVEAGGRHWEPYRRAPMGAFLGLAALLAEDFPALRDPANWVGHCDIRRTKSDPGAHFPWFLLRDMLEHRQMPELADVPGLIG